MDPFAVGLRALLAAVLLLPISGCAVQVAIPSLPAPSATVPGVPSPTLASPSSGVAPTSSPTRSPTAWPTHTPSPSPNPEAALTDLVEAMQQAVLTGDQAAYLALVDLGDPVFAVEHTRWSNEWFSGLVLREYSLSVDDVSVAGSRATGTMTVTWETAELPSRTASLVVQFRRTATDGQWRYAGEAWVTEQMDRFVVHVAPGLESEIPRIGSDLPAIYEHVTDSIGYEPAGVMEIKLYSDAAALVSQTLLSLPDIHGWNEPGEALKMRLDPEVPSLTPTIAHEFTHFAVFDRAGTQRSRNPWWLDEGIATYVQYHFEDPELAQFRMDQVRGWAEGAELADWRQMAVFETTPEELWQFVYAQGYVMVSFVTETFGEATRNEWLAAMATERDIDEATETHFDMSFDELDAAFRDWLLD